MDGTRRPSESTCFGRKSGFFSGGETESVPGSVGRSWARGGRGAARGWGGLLPGGDLAVCVWLSIAMRLSDFKL